MNPKPRGRWLSGASLLVYDALLLTVAYQVTSSNLGALGPPLQQGQWNGLVPLLASWAVARAITASPTRLLDESSVYRAAALTRLQVISSFFAATYLYAAPLEAHAMPTGVVLFGTQLCHLGFQIAALTVFRPTGDASTLKRRRFVGQAAVVTLSFALLHWTRFGPIAPSPTYRAILQALLCFWVVVSSLVHGFDLRRPGGLFATLWLFWISEAAITFVTVILLLATGEISHSRLLVLGTIVLSAAAENLFTIVAMLKDRAGLDSIPVIREIDAEAGAIAPYSRSAAEGAEIRSGIPSLAAPDQSRSSVRAALHLQQRDSLVAAPSSDLLEFIERHIDLSQAEASSSSVFAAQAFENLTFHRDGSRACVINLERMNLIPHLNRYLGRANAKLCQDGVLVGLFQSYGQRTREIFRGSPRPVAVFLDSAESLVLRVFTKLPFIGRIATKIAGDRTLRMSVTEGLGRLCRAGFEITGLGEVGDGYCFIARKRRPYPHGPEPDYGLLFRQKRAGCGGTPILVYKLRTMHCYAEYLHQHLLNTTVLAENGKLDQDFRTPRWGRFLRRWWIDELPMLVNVLRGELKLVGVRPISYSFLEIYPADLREERAKYRPGLIPPFYADLPRGLDEILASERRYLAEFARTPLKTDFAYLIRAFSNIAFGRARSS